MKNFNIAKYNEILDRGLASGIGTQQGSMCIEAAVCAALDLPHGDDPKCVAQSVRRFKIRLNDARWSSPAARSAGLRDLGIAQLGSVDVPDLNQEFAKRIALQTIQKIIPAMLRDLYKDKYESHALACEQSKNLKEARSAAYYAAAYYAANAAAAAANAAAAAAANAAAAAAANAAAANAAAAAAAAYAAAANADVANAAADASDKYLIMSAQIALQILRDLKSPGCEILESIHGN